MKYHSNQRKLSVNGFTIVELLIATVVFSSVLLLVTTGVLTFTSVFFKGLNESSTQAAAINAENAVAQAIQFNTFGRSVATPSPTPGSAQYFCVGGQEFSYVLGDQLTTGTPGSNQTNHSLVVTDQCRGAPYFGGGATPSPTTELLDPGMRLSNFTVSCAQVSCTNDAYKVDIRVVFGNDPLLSNPTASNAACLGQAGDQFCAESDLSTVVVKRVQ